MRRTMRRTVQIGVSNLATIAAVIVDPADAREHLVRRDLAAAAALGHDLDDLAAYLQADSDRAHYFSAVADREITRRAGLDADAARRQQERFILTQTAIVTAMLLVLTAVQALGYQVPLPTAAKPAVIATLGGAALWLVTIAVRLASHEPTLHRRRRSVARLGRGLVEALACGGFLASLGWLTTVLTDNLTRDASGLTVAPTHAAGAGLVLGTAASAVAGWRRHRRAGRAS